MNEKVLYTLEYDKILARLAEFASCQEIKEACLKLRPIADRE